MLARSAARSLTRLATCPAGFIPFRAVSSASPPSKTSRPPSGINSPPRPARPFTAAAASAAAAEAMAPPGELQIERVPCLSDNYAWILHEASTGATAVVDPSEAAPVEAALARLGWRLTHILNTHHHADHTGGNLALKKRHGATIVGPAADAQRIPGIDVALADGERYSVGAAELVCFDTPGHTRGHVTLHFPGSKALFPGDTLFALGCGRLFEGTPAQMWASLSKLLPLPQDTKVYCAHEYTQSNARFAVAVDPGNEELQRRKADIDAARAKGEATVPSLLGEELRTNPFLRPNNPEIRAALGVPADAPDDVAFAAIRAAKDSFRGGGASAASLVRMGFLMAKQQVANMFL